jgi:hypothetical protein
MFSRPRAREQQEYTFAKQQYTPIPLTYSSLHTLFLCSSGPHCCCATFYLNNPLVFAPTPSPTAQPHLASRLTVPLSRFAQTTRLSAQTTRLRLKQLNKPRDRPLAGDSLPFLFVPLVVFLLSLLLVTL